ncbi:MAG: winged helix-turn-helix transcriptional regulator, partial [Leptolyngbya sp. SIO4C1]|nr:winged helix-turn-helix transcriptional regulator [Leptolyngbya sp. SIO4C1]
MAAPQFETLLAFFKALANESRLKLVGLLAQREHSVEEMAALLQLKEPTVSAPPPSIANREVASYRIGLIVRMDHSHLHLACRIFAHELSGH